MAWRLCKAQHRSLDGKGAEKYGGRWNSPGIPVVYLCKDPALCVLEVLVNLDLPPELIPQDYELVKVDLSAFQSFETINVMETLEQGFTGINQSRDFGDSWIANELTPLLEVPSIIIPESKNLLLNPNHPASPHINIDSSRVFEFDQRLI